MFDALADPKIRAATQNGVEAGEDGALITSGSSAFAALPPAQSFDANNTDSIIEARDALRTKYFKKNLAASIIFNIILNVVIGYISLSTFDSEGLWETPKVGTPNDASQIWFDLPLTCFLVTFLTTVVLSPVMKGEVKKGTIAPVSDASLSRGIYRVFPMSVRNPWVRGAIIGLIFFVIWSLPTIFAFAMACSAGWMKRNGDDTCQVSAVWYIWVKGLYAGVTAGLVYPLAMVSGLNRAHLPNYWYQCYLQKQFQLRAAGAAAAGGRAHIDSHGNGSSPLLEDGLRSG